MDLASNPTIKGVTVSNNGVNALVLDAGSIVGNRNWTNPDIVYRTSGKITVPKASTLTVGAGQIVKFRFFASDELLVDGKLLVQGAADRKVVFTSSRDDSIGGDTDNNGTTIGFQGDWNAVVFGTGSVGNTLNHLDIRFAGAFRNGAIQADGANIKLQYVTINRSFTSGVFARNTILSMTNSIVFRSRDAAVLIDGGSKASLINNTLDNNWRGIAADGATTQVTITNNLITNFGSVGVSRTNGAALSISHNLVFRSATGGRYEGVPDPTGSSGNISIDPKYTNAATDQFQLRAGSKAIDSGSSTGAPASDFLGNPRFDDPNVVNSGTGSTPFIDMGAIERQSISISDVDLVTVNVVGAIQGLQGQVVGVEWQVRNQGTGVAGGAWRDAVYLSRDRAWSQDDLLLGTVQRDSELGVGDSYSASGNFTLPGVLPGEHFFIVVSNFDDEVFEAKARANNIRSSNAPIDMDLPELQFGIAQNATLISKTDKKFFKFTAAAGIDFQATLTGASGATNQLHWQFADLPSVQQFNGRGIRSNQSNQSVSGSSLPPGTHYLMVSSTNMPGATQSFSIQVQQRSYSITDVQPRQGGNRGSVTINVFGAQFTPGSTVRMIDANGSTIQAKQVVFVDSGLLNATFDLDGKAIGKATIQVVKPGNNVTSLPNTFEIVAGQEGRLSTTISAPWGVRLGRDFVITVDYRNTGNQDLMAPIFRVKGTGLSNMSFYEEMTHASSALELIGVNPLGQAGILPPGTSGRITLYGTTKTVGDERLDVEVAQYPDTLIDWNAIEPTIRPPDLGNTEWNQLFAKIKLRVGNNWSDYVKAISEASSQVSDSRFLPYSLRDVFHFLVEDARASVNTSVSGRITSAGVQGESRLESNSLTMLNTITGRKIFTPIRSDGTFTFNNVPAGTYTFVAGKFLIGTHNPVIVQNTNVTNIQLTAEFGATVRGSVLLKDVGAPLADVLVRAVSNAGEVYTTTTDRDGAYEFLALKPGTYSLESDDPRFVRGVVADIVLKNNDVRPQTNLVLTSGATIAGTVRGPSNAPVAEALVVAFDATGVAIGRSAYSDANGRYVIGGVPNGTFSVQASKSGFTTATVIDVSIVEGQSASNKNLSLKVGGEIQGLVQKADGSELGFVVLSAEKDGKVMQVTQANSSGGFRFVDLEPGSYVIRTSLQGYSEVSSNAAVQAGKVTNLPSMKLSSLGKISGKVTKQANGQGLENLFVMAYVNGKPVAYAVTDAAGTYSIPHLNVGDYYLTVSTVGSDGIVGSQVSITNANKTPTANFVLPIVGELEGRTLDSDGKTAISNARVVLLRNAKSYRAFFLTLPASFGS